MRSTRKVSSTPGIDESITSRRTRTRLVCMPSGLSGQRAALPGSLADHTEWRHPVGQRARFLSHHPGLALINRIDIVAECLTIVAGPRVGANDGNCACKLKRSAPPVESSIGRSLITLRGPSLLISE